MQQKSNTVAVFREVATPPYMDVAKNFTGRSKILLWLQQKSNTVAVFREVATPPYMDVAKTSAVVAKNYYGCSKKQTLLPCFVRYMDVAKTSALVAKNCYGCNKNRRCHHREVAAPPDGCSKKLRQ